MKMWKSLNQLTTESNLRKQFIQQASSPQDQTTEKKSFNKLVLHSTQICH